ncbi:hypothetical protein M1432_01015 [Patescibacteria group bacterium]|nr:hypothetical protein [Patescibacteria group bacterium]
MIRNWRFWLTIFVVFIVALFIGVHFSYTQPNPISLDAVNLIFLILAIVSGVLSVVAITFSWIFYESSQKLNQEANSTLTKVTEKTSKIDEMLTNQFNKLLARRLGLEEYEGTLPISDIKVLGGKKKSSIKKRK